MTFFFFSFQSSTKKNIKSSLQSIKNVYTTFGKTACCRKALMSSSDVQNSDTPF